MSDEKMFGIDSGKFLSMFEDLYKVCEKHGTADTTAAMIAYSAFLIPRNIYREGWREDAIDFTVRTLRRMAEDRMAELQAGPIEEVVDEVNEPQATHEYTVDWELWIEELMKAGDTDGYIH